MPFHYMGAVFAFLIVLQLVLGKLGMIRDTPYVQQDAKAVDLTLGSRLLLSVRF